MNIAGKPRAQTLSARNCFNYLTLPQRTALPCPAFASAFTLQQFDFGHIKDMKINEITKRQAKKCDDPMRALQKKKRAFMTFVPKDELRRAVLPSGKLSHRRGGEQRKDQRGAGEHGRVRQKRHAARDGRRSHEANDA